VVAGSSLMLEELWKSGDDGFLAELLRIESEKHLAAFAERLWTDRRPFARRMLLAYIDDGADRDHHRPLVKRLFKRAEKAGDDEAMGHFLVAFDRLARRELREVQRWDWQTRESHTAFELQRVPAGPGQSRFSQATRLYLVRRAWRYFRFLGWREPARYQRAMMATLPLYQDQHLSKPENVLDSWGLVHALYHGSDVLERHQAGTRLRPGRTLAELAPAPFKPAVWTDRHEDLFELVQHAGSRTVRAWAIAWLRAHANLSGLPLSRVRPMLRSQHDEVVLFGAELLRSVAGLETMLIGDWLELLQIRNATALPIVCELMEKHVAPSRLRATECVTLAQSPMAAVAALGLRWLRDKPGVELETVLGLGEAEVPPVRAQAVEWLLERIRGSAASRPEHLRELIDARHLDTRERALALWEAEPRFHDDGTLWAALPESPYEDVRARVIAHLERRLAELTPGSIRHIWVSALLAVHRGGRAKPLVARQISRRIADHPAEADDLLPLLGIALRSLRQPERRAGLAALVRAAETRPGLRAQIQRHLPELHILDDAGTARASVQQVAP
jgi:hypothetical protein